VVPDARFLRLGLVRCLDHFDSGRDFLQALGDQGDTLAKSTFFDALHDPRRLHVIQEVSERLSRFAAAQIKQDWLESIAELGSRQVWAVDGHQIEHACHALRDRKGARVPPGSLYSLNLRNGLMHLLGSHQGDGRRTHEVKAFKALFSAQIARKGFPVRPIIVADMAFIDNGYWTRLRLDNPDAPVLNTRQKENMRPLSYGPIPFDPSAPINAGVTNYEMVGFDNCLTMYRVTYKDPESGSEFIFLTTDSTLTPGVVAILYRLRWKIEKTYPTCKSKLHLTKAWANGKVAQEMQAHFTALTHNLLTMLLGQLRTDHDISEKKLLEKHDYIAQERARKKSQPIPFM